MSEEVGSVSEDKSDDRHDSEAADEDLVNPFIISGAHILACEAERCLVDRIHRCIDKSLDVGGSSISRHSDRTERVDG